MELPEKIRNSDYLKFIKLLESNNYCFACISACHIEDLKINILSNTFSFFSVEGRYIEEKAGPVIEKSFLLYTKKENRDNLFNFSIAMCEQYKQDSIMFIESDKTATCYNQFGEVCQKYKPTDNYIFNNTDLTQYATHFGSRVQSRNFSVEFFKENLENLNLLTLYYNKLQKKHLKEGT